MFERTFVQEEFAFIDNANADTDYAIVIDDDGNENSIHIEFCDDLENEFEIMCQDIGVIFACNDEKLAFEAYHSYARLAIAGLGRVKNKTISLMMDRSLMMAQTVFE